ncbi:mechanosensitive ion channel family protein [Halobaculum gomorrense]|uniref:Mechanosensitive ion channel n=1 Tax=Halobaculum gomorrense TaxID=43928 RepID=A0A1M5SK14_9EURY|nr:mechanosensitive ion channel family protein [Halobaculum gomorrense]SHH38886.1 Mechanosensitive ion channel [Halobaculum gomorrense]
MRLAFLVTLRETLEGFVTTEARLAATVVLLTAAAVTALLFTPRAVRGAHRLVRDRVLANERVPVEMSELDWRFPVNAIVRTLQFAVVLGGGLATLVVWGYVEVAFAAVAAMAATLPAFAKVLTTAAIVAGALIAIDVLEARLDDYAAESDAINQHQKGIVFRLLQLAVLAAAVVGGLTVWGINLGGLLVGAGFLGIVIGTAARSTIGSLIAGFVLMFSRPFELGDWVAIDGEEGIVSDITVINTRIRTAGGEVVVIPNDRVANAVVTNLTRLGQLRLSVDVGVDYDADLATAEAVVSDALAGVSEIEDNPPPQVIPKSLGDSAVVLECRFWIDRPSAPKRALATASVVRAVKTALDDAGIKIPYPQREVTGREETGGFRVAEGRGEPPGAAAPGAEN